MWDFELETHTLIDIIDSIHVLSEGVSTQRGDLARRETDDDIIIRSSNMSEGLFQ